VTGPRVGCHALAWGDAPLERVVVDVAAAGYAGVEPWTPPVRSDPERVRRLAADAGLTVAGVYWSPHLDDADPTATLDGDDAGAGAGAHDGGDEDDGGGVAAEARWLATAVEAAGADRLLLGPPMRDRIDGPVTDAHREAFADRAAAAVAAVRRSETAVVACVHPHYDSLLETPADLARFDERAARRLAALGGGGGDGGGGTGKRSGSGSSVDADPDPIPLAVDTAHLFLGGFDAATTVRERADRVVHVHLKDVRPVPESERASWPEATRPLGDGAVDLDAALDALDAIGYDDWLVVEQDRTSDPADAAERSRAFLRERGY
jgi:sugar phosphate isomerase/epimerase